VVEILRPQNYGASGDRACFCMLDSGETGEDRCLGRVVGCGRLCEVRADDELHGCADGNRDTGFSESNGGQRVCEPSGPSRIGFLRGGEGAAAPNSTDFTAEAQSGLSWLMKMWDSTTKNLYYQVDNTQEWNYYSSGSPSSTAGNCGGTYASPFCLTTEYDIWTLPQAAANYQQAGDPEACDPLTTFCIRNRPVFLAAPAGSKISRILPGGWQPLLRCATN